MASKLFKDLSANTLEKIRDAIASKAGALNDVREQLYRENPEMAKFAKVHVGYVLIDPRDKSASLLVSYSDQDVDTPALIDEFSEGAVRA